MDPCCHRKQEELEKTATRHRKVLWLVLTINLVMFIVELGAGLAANSLAILGDSLDMLGDAITYASSLMVVGLSAIKKARVSALKATIMLLFGLAISIRCIQAAFSPQAPDFGIMFYIGLLALAANLLCLVALMRHRNDDINMRSVWVCSRNDIIANCSVLLAAFAVAQTASFWPDLIVGLGLAILFAYSALGILRDVAKTMRQEP